jgi:hypothetical protein
MTKQLLVSNVPDEVRRWIERERQQRRMSQQEFVLSVLQRTSIPYQTLSLPFFEQVQKEDGISSQDLPFKFIDLFEGVGGFRLALEGIGGMRVPLGGGHILSENL